MPFDRYESLGSFFGRIKRSSSWWIGDWLNFGEKVYGEEMYQAAEATGLNENTLRHYQFVCQQVPRSRRIARLGFGHHVMVVNLEAADQTFWLRKAASEGWTEKDMRAEMQQAGVLRQRPEPVTPDPLFPEDSAPIPLAPLREVAEAILRDAQPHADGQHHLVPNEDIARLGAVLGTEE